MKKRMYYNESAHEFRRLRRAPNFYAIGRYAGYVIMFVIGYFVTIALRLIFNI